MALAARCPDGPLLHHSDRGCQYADNQYREMTAGFGLSCRMSRVGDCWDNAVVASLWAALKKELVHQRTFATRREAEAAVFERIVVWYNRKRRHGSLGYLGPDAFEARN
jgi:putative transposase